MKDREHQIQTACVNWFRMQYKGELIYAIPNGGARNIITASKLKAEGVTSGVPDLCIPVMRKGFGGLYIEMKDGKKGRLSDNQKDMIDRLKSNGYCVEVCRSVDDFINVVNGYML